MIGIPIANRHYKELENVIGFFVNTLAVRTYIDSEETAEILIDKTKHTMTESQLHQDIPFEKIVDLLNVDKDFKPKPNIPGNIRCAEFWEVLLKFYNGDSKTFPFSVILSN